MLLKDASRTKNNQELVKASIDALVKALEGGHSEALSSYLTATAQFHNYSFQKILLIASQRAVTCCYTSLESMNMRSSHCWKQAMERSTFSEDNSVSFRIRSSLLSNLMLLHER
jgi:hypothetical protein